MLFLTVGHQTPFDRLVQWMDRWAAQHNRTDIFAQIGAGDYLPKSFPYERFISPDLFNAKITEASAIVGHAGTGTIIAAVQHHKPLLVVPRLASLNETRNDHQLATVRHFVSAGYMLAADSEPELHKQLALLPSFQPTASIDGAASPELLHRLRDFIATS
ncbi:MAG TPA: glycosyltransferase [Phycisphaerales bacterium]|nr:glycosyltransferase [Phycisphaerales bacterium]